MRSVQEHMFKAHEPGKGFTPSYLEDKTEVRRGRPAPVEEDPAL